MEVSGHVKPAICAGKEFLVPLGYGAGWDAVKESKI
jgi:hypothetical protein